MAIAEAGVWADLQKVEDPVAIMGYGVTLTPALIINDYVQVSGRVPSQEEVTEIISRANLKK